MKKIVLLITILSCFMLWVKCVGAEPVISVLSDKASVNAGEIFTISVNAEAEQLTGIQFDIEYNAQAAEYQNAEITSVFDNALVKGIEAVSPGKVTLLAAFTDGEDISGEVCSITFKTLGGICDLQIKNIKLMINGEKTIEDDIPVSINAGNVTPDGNGSSGSSSGTSSGSSSSSGSSGTSSGSSSSGSTSSGSTGSSTHKNDTVDNETIDKKDDSSEKDDKIETTEESFSDINGHWAKEAITAMLKAGIVSGVGDNKFAPDKAVKRSELACMIANALNLTDISENEYTDVEKGLWYENSVLKCTKAKIMLGNDGTFRPDDYVTREETAAVTARAAAYLGLSFDVTDKDISFTDYDSVSSWARDSVKEMAAAGIINGYEDGSFRPSDVTTRAHAAVILNKLSELKKGNFEGDI